MVLAAKTFRDDATYWSPARQTGTGGFEFGDPQVIKVRWEDRNELFVDQNGNEARSRAIVYSQQVLEPGGYLVRGESVAADPQVVQGAYEISRFDSLPDLRGLNQEYKAYM